VFRAMHRRPDAIAAKFGWPSCNHLVLSHLQIAP